MRLTQPNKELSQSGQISYSGGVNLRASRLDIPDRCATEITNADITVDGVWRKRREPKFVATLSSSPTGFVNGMASFVDGSGNPWVISTLDGHVFKWDGVTSGTQGNGHVTEYTPKLPDDSSYALNATNRIRFARVYNNLYGVDGSSYLFRFNGSECKAVVGTAQELPIVPGTLVMSNGTSADNVTDDGAGNLIQNSVQVGTVSYTTGIYRFSPAFPWASGTVTASYDKPVLQTEDTLIRAASDGTLQYRALAHSPIAPASLELTDGSNVVTSSWDDAGGGYPSGWRKLILGAAQVGAYEAETGKFIVDNAAFTAGLSVTASYRHSTATANETMTGQSFVEAVYGTDTTEYFSGYTVAHAANGIVEGSLSLSGGPQGSRTDASNLDGTGNITLGGTLAQFCVVHYASGVIDSGGFDPGPPHDIYSDPGITYQYWTTATTNEAVGSADADGKLYRYTTTVTPISAYGVTIYEGSNTVTGTPAGGGGGTLYKGASAVGTITTDGVISVTSTGTFTAYSSPKIKYYTDGSVTGQSIAFGNLAGAIGGLVPYGAQDVLWWNNRLWLTGDNSLSFSDAYAPESFSQPPLAVSATGKLKLLGFSYNRLYLFNAEAGSLGEIFYVDVTEADPTKWRATSLFAGMNFVSTDCIVRAATNDSADVFYFTAEGWRSLKTTVQDHVAGPSLPFDFNVRPWLDDLNRNELNKSWAVVFDDELLVWLPKSGSSTPGIVFAYNMKTVRQSPQDGWTKIDMPESSGIAGVEAHCGCKADFGAGERLYIGTVSGGKIVQMFGADATAENFTATTISKGLDFNDRFSDTMPLKLMVRLTPDSIGTLNATLIDDQDVSYNLGDKTVETSGDKNFVRVWDCRYKTGGIAGQETPQGKDWRVQLSTSNQVGVQGFALVILPSKTRWIQDEETNAASSTLSALSIGNITGGAISA